MTPQAKDKMTFWHLIFSNYGIPIIIGLGTLNLWFLTQIYTDYKEGKKQTEVKLWEHETRITVIEYWKNNK